ncbi:glucans biosynthesis glucosyltransferase MdoH [Roseibium sp.]|uniref:glucans biosynthesis glucosyltransferase MdoH n=1 Tax=Roseibium sp. TaxID=1936156 RepID=UPI003A985172
MRDVADLHGTVQTPHQAMMRRIVFATLVVASICGLALLMMQTLSPGGIGVLKGLMFGCFLATLPWTVIGFWNAVIGLAVMWLSRDAVSAVSPVQADPQKNIETSRTALLSCIRDEDAQALETRLGSMLAGLCETDDAGRFSLFILSDSFKDDIAVHERAAAKRLQDRWGQQIEIIYRRRTDNTGFKAGNIADFAERWGHGYDYAIPLDADSYMSPEAILDLVRRMDANPHVGILQSLVVGLPARSAFARVFQYGMRLGMRSYTIGSAWWQGDCGPYWGHNAILRLKPFMDHCSLPVLPGNGPLGGTILSHDQVEAVLMRRAGYEVRVLPKEQGSYEENPPHLLEFIRRDLRWCQGNLQYIKLLTLPGLRPVSRVQLFLAILMFIGSPAWIGFMFSAALAGLVEGEGPLFRSDSGFTLFLVIMTMVFAPKLATMADILTRPDLRKAFGGAHRIVASTFVEIVFSSMLAPIMAMAHTLFMGGLLFGKTIGWGAQGRDVEQLSFALSASKLWPQTLFGLLGVAWLSTQPLELVWPAIPIAIGPLLAIPFAMATSTPRVGDLLVRSGFWRIPEETAPPAELFALRLPALQPEAFHIRPEANEDSALASQSEPIRLKA